MIIDSPIISGSSVASGSLNQFGNVTITGSVNVSGSFTSTGTITAQTLVVQTVTSSTVYSSGSNIFGNDLANTQVLTGSVSITGSLAVNGSNVVLSNQTSSMSASYALNATSASYAANATTASYANTSTSASYSNNSTSASYANNATSASYAANATTSSYSNNSTSASYANNATTASYALVAAAGGFPYTGSAQITGSLGVTGSVDATSFTGSLLGTSSYAVYSLTSSYSLAGSGFPFSGSAVITGSLLVTNLSSSGVSYLVADAAGFVTAQTASAAIKSTQAVTSTAGQTSFNITNGYTTGLVDVYINGTKLSAVEYTDTSGTVITLATGSNNGDTVEFVKYFPASGVTNNALRQQTTITASAGQTVFSASYTPGLLDIYYNGARLSTSDYTANSGTYFTLATASAASDILDVLVYSYQVGAFSGIGGAGTASQVAYFDTTNSITGSPNFTISGSTMLITGSLTVSGSGTFTNIGPAVFSGSLTSTAGFTGSFSGTATSASYAANADLLDGLDSSVFTLTSSFAAQTASFTAFTASFNAFSASIYTATSSFSGRVGALESYTASLNSKTSSFATTGSNTFIGTQTLTGSILQSGSFTTTGTIIAQTINVQQVTSSVIYSSGSNIFGNLISNTQVFTGSVLITGSLTSTGATCFVGNAIVSTAGNTTLTINGTSGVPALSFTNTGGTNNIYGGVGSVANITIAPGDVNAVKVFAAGCVSCFAGAVCVPNIISTGASGGRYGTFNAPTNGGYITFEAGGTPFGDLGSYCAQIGTCDATTLLLGSRTGYALALGSNSTERLRISVGGLLLLNGASSRTTGFTTNPAGHYAAELTNYGGAQYFTNNTNAEGSYLVLGKSKGSSVNSNTAVVNSDALGALLYHGTDGTAAKEAAAIYGHVDGNVTTGCIPGRLSFWTSYNGVLTERMRISSTGAACFACELTAKTLGTNDLILNNLNYECANYVDGTRGSWLIQEGQDDLFIINQISCKKYKFNLIEIK